MDSQYHSQLLELKLDLETALLYAESDFERHKRRQIVGLCARLSSLIRSVLQTRVDEHGLPFPALLHPPQLLPRLSHDLYGWRYGKLDLSCSNVSRCAHGLGAGTLVSARIGRANDQQLLWQTTVEETSYDTSDCHEWWSSSSTPTPSSCTDLRQAFEERWIAWCGADQTVEELSCPVLPSLSEQQSWPLLPSYCSPALHIDHAKVSNTFCWSRDSGGLVSSDAAASPQTVIYSLVQGAPLIWVMIEARHTSKLRQRMVVRSTGVGLGCSRPDATASIVPSLAQLDEWGVGFELRLQNVGDIIAWHSERMVFALKLGASIIHRCAVLDKVEQSSVVRPSDVMAASHLIPAQTKRVEASPESIPTSEEDSVPFRDGDMARQDFTHVAITTLTSQRSSTLASRQATEVAQTHPSHYARKAKSAKRHVASNLDTSDDSSANREGNSDNESSSFSELEVDSSRGRPDEDCSAATDRPEDDHHQAARALIDFRSLPSPSPTNHEMPMGIVQQSRLMEVEEGDGESGTMATPVRSRSMYRLEHGLQTPPNSAERHHNPIVASSLVPQKRQLSQLLARDEGPTQGHRESLSSRVARLELRWKTVYAQFTDLRTSPTKVFHAIKLALAIGSPAALAQLAEICQTQCTDRIAYGQSLVETEFQGYVVAQNSKAHMECKSHIHARALYRYYVERLEKWQRAANDRETARPHVTSCNDVPSFKPKASGKALDDLGAACLRIPRGDDTALSQHRRRVTQLRDCGKRVHEFERRLWRALETAAASQVQAMDKLSVLALLPLQSMTSQVDGTTIRPSDFWHMEESQFPIVASVLVQRENFLELAQKASAAEEALLKGMTPEAGFSCPLLHVAPTDVAATPIDSHRLLDLFQDGTTEALSDGVQHAPDHRWTPSEA